MSFERSEERTDQLRYSDSHAFTSEQVSRGRRLFVVVSILFVFMHLCVWVRGHSCARRCTCPHSSTVCRCSSSRVVHRCFVRAVSLAQLVRTRTRPYENTTLPKPPATLSIRSLVLVHLHRLPLTIGGKVVDINPPSLSHELPCQTSRCNWLPCGGPHHPSKEETRKLIKTRQRDECGKTPEGRNARRNIHTRVQVCRYTYGVFLDPKRTCHGQRWKNRGARACACVPVYAIIHPCMHLG